ncbi:hypothetical protein [Brevibacterium sp. SMBL_HHYL_HB1]|uniref:hypothetical protein n=1 Tax=Brevibacterium sp. SMBL_HHYL_HB1 TaxID=2777556 RepID=UPI001BA74E3D|nr:hypothetical protein [Brevibacterium sp. SMBL_HHYL_HB1]QUL80652.1 hypothetical protein IG171_07810 [Brevibacterium sp. SMBL_HHYL_HB1]
MPGTDATATTYSRTVTTPAGEDFTLIADSPLGIVQEAGRVAETTSIEGLADVLTDPEFERDLLARAVFTIEAESLVAEFARTLASVDNPEFAADETVGFDQLMTLPSVRDAVEALRHVFADRSLEVVRQQLP